MFPVPNLHSLHRQSLEEAPVQEGREGGQLHAQELAEHVQVFEDELGQQIVRHVCQHPQEQVHKLATLFHSQV